MSMIKYRVHEVAKDFGMPTKAVTQILTLQGRAQERRSAGGEEA